MGGDLYDRIGVGYADRRRPDDRIAAEVLAALGTARTVCNVGAGSGSYEPLDRRVVAIEPSVGMLRQRAPGAAPAIRGAAEDLPLRDRWFDATLGILTIHHWRDWRRGLAEMRRVTRERIVILTWDPAHPGFWLSQDYLPEILAVDRPIFPSVRGLGEVLGPIEVRPVPIPADCTDGFLGAYWRRPEEYLDPRVRLSISTFSRLRDPGPGLRRLEADLASGRWKRRYGSLARCDELDLGYRLVVAARDGRTKPPACP